MSEPYIQVYAADMRADPKVIALPVAMRYALIQAWDLAKNGPGACDELRSSDGRAMRERELRTLSSVSANETRAMFERWRSVGLCEIEDGLVRFPNLAKRQGIDRTAAERMRRHRLRKRYGEQRHEVTPQRYGPVTGENQNQNQKPDKERASNESLSSPRTRKPDPIWDAFVATLGVDSQMTKSERGRLNAACKELRDLDADPRDVPRVASRLREKWGGRASVTPGAIVGNWTATLAELPNGNGFKPLSREEYQRIADEREARTHDATTDEEIPF